jgi:hypothetical protein
MTQPSVRSLGRKVYLGAVVILINLGAPGRQVPTPRRVHELARLFGVDYATVTRWQAFWRDYGPQTPFWKLGRGRVEPVRLTYSALAKTFASTREDNRSPPAG